MKSQKYSGLICCVALLLITIGCSRGDPTGNPMQQNQSGNDWNADVLVPAGIGVLGLYEITVNPETMFAEMNPVRTTSSTDVLETVDITNFLTMAPCTDCAKLTGFSIDNNDLPVIFISVRHPFPAGDLLKPVSG